MSDVLTIDWKLEIRINTSKNNANGMSVAVNWNLKVAFPRLAEEAEIELSQGQRKSTKQQILNRLLPGIFSNREQKAEYTVCPFFVLGPKNFYLTSRRLL